MIPMKFARQANWNRLSAELSKISGATKPSVLPNGVQIDAAQYSLVHDSTTDQIIVWIQDDLAQSVQDAISAAVMAHDSTPDPVPPVPDYGQDVPDNFAFQVANGVVQARQYLGIASPTLAQTSAVVKLLIRLVLWRLKVGGTI